MLSVTSESHYFPNNSSSITTDEAGLAYFNEIKDFFVQTLGFFVYGEMKTYDYVSSSKTYTSYCYFFSDKQNGTPIFCIHTPSTQSTSAEIKKRFSYFILEPCTFNDIEFFPLKYPITTNSTLSSSGDQGIVTATKIQPYSINFKRTDGSTGTDVSANDSMGKTDIIVQDVKFLDGRRIIFFKSQMKTSHEWMGKHNWGAMFFTDIVFKNNIIRDWVFFSVALGGSYNPIYNQHIVNKNLSEDNTNFINLQKIIYPTTGSSTNGTWPISTSLVAGGLIPGIYSGKDYLIKHNFYIGDEAYIPQIYRYSNVLSLKISDDKKNIVNTDKGKIGDYITIRNNNFLIICNRFLYPADLATGWDSSTIGDGAFGNLSMGSYATKGRKAVNTESLLIPI